VKVLFPANVENISADDLRLMYKNRVEVYGNHLETSRIENTMHSINITRTVILIKNWYRLDVPAIDDLPWTFWLLGDEEGECRGDAHRCEFEDWYCSGAGKREYD